MSSRCGMHGADDDGSGGADADAGGAASRWQDDAGLCAAVLHEVFSWLEARELCTASSVCSVWREAAYAPALWRRLLVRDARLAPALLATLARNTVSWRAEYERMFAGWERCEPGEGARKSPPALRGAQHAALACSARRLALVSEYAELAIWEASEEGFASWCCSCTVDLRARGWARAERAQWAAGGARLLVLGALALVHAQELLALEVREGGGMRVLSHARCSPGAGGCWAGPSGQAYLSLELHLLAPSVALTTVWLNAATQETGSEFAGVTSRLLRIYCEESAHITLATVAEVLPDERSKDKERAPGDQCYQRPASGVDSDDSDLGLDVVIERGRGRSSPLLVAGSGVRGGGLLRAWPLEAARAAPAPLRAAAGGDLLTRRARRAAAAAAPAAPPPDADAVRALCAPPAHECALPAPPTGLVVHHSGCCVWASLGDGGAWCGSLPALRPLRRLLAPEPTALRTPLHYDQPALSDMYFVSGSGRWSALTGACCSRARAPPLPAPPLVALLPPTPPRTRPLLLLLAAGEIHVRARAVCRSCAGEIPPPTGPPYKPRPRPPCRQPPACRASVAEQRVCCAPPRSRQPPCPARPPAAPRTCAAARRAKSDAEVCVEPCSGQDRVALRLAAADGARRRQFEEKAAQRAARGTAPLPSAEYAPGAARDCLPAMNGRTYSLPCRLPPPPRCGPGRAPPPPRAVPLAREPGCRLEREPDPCAHRPPVFLDVDRSSSLPSPAPPPSPATLPAPRAPGACGPSRRPPPGLTERIVSGLRGERPPERRLHTAPGLREAGLGRARVPCGGGHSTPSAAAGRLDLAVPAGTSRVSVLVTMSAPGGGQCTRGGKLPAPPRRRASWLSISSIRRKFAGCGGGNVDVLPKKPSKCPSTTSPCRPATPACPPAAPATPLKRKKSPSCPCVKKPSPCQKSGSKTKFIPLLQLL